MSAWYMRFCSVSGRSTITTSAACTASAMVRTLSPASSAFGALDEPSRRPTTTSTPESFRFSACAWPCEPYPRIATVLPSSNPRSAPSSYVIVAAICRLS